MVSSKSATLLIASLLLSTASARFNIIERDGRPLQSRRFGVNNPPALDKLRAACGGGVCATLAGDAISTILAGAPECAQQDMADRIIDEARAQADPAVTANMIAIAREFRQAEKNTPPDFTSQPPLLRNSVFCQKAPKNSELNGLVQGQDPANDPELFFDPANPGRTIRRGEQPNTFPFGQGGGGGAAPAPAPAPAPSPAPAAPSSPAAAPSPAPAAPPANNNNGGNNNGGNNGGGGNGGFALDNGRAAQALNAKFAGLNTGSSCTDGEQACVNGGFAQCVGGKFAITQCSGGLVCAALPLVNSRGTSITCTTEADALARIAATGAGNSLTGNGVNAAPAPAPAQNNNNNTPAANVNAANGNGGFALDNGRDAQALNRKFASLNADSSCTPGEQACVSGAFAQCVNGKFVSTPCAGGLTCAALPLVNSRGTSITCTTLADAQARIARTGAGNSITG